MKKIKTIFIGTSEFAIPILKKISELDYIDLNLIVTQPDKPFGRKQKLKAPALKTWANENLHTINILQPEKIKKISQEILNTYEPELIIVASYGQIIPNNMLEYPKFKCLNIHGSVLPKLRGAVPIQRAILDGMSSTGVTLQKMVQKMDKGDIISIREIDIEQKDTTESLFRKLEKLSVQMLNDDLIKWVNGEIAPIPQDELEVTYCGRDDISKQNAEVQFNTDIDLVERMVRAFYPWPVAWFMIPEGKYQGKRIKIFKSKIHSQKINPEFGLEKVDGKLVLNLKNGCLEILELQLEGKKRRGGEEYFYLVD